MIAESNKNWLLDLTGRVKQGESAGREEARRILALDKDCFHVLLFAATELRTFFMGSRIKTCAIVNAKSGRCSEDCTFCAQSSRHSSQTASYPLMSGDDILERAALEEAHSRRFGIVTAGRSLPENEIGVIAQALEGFSSRGLHQSPCASLGILGEDGLRRLKDAGLTRYHHNLEASKNFYPRVCTTHSYRERVETIQAAQRAGLETCVGGIMGIGEQMEDRIDLLMEIRAMAPDAVPVNFLVPIQGTPLDGRPQIPLWDAVKAIALTRFLMPDKDIKLGAGRLEVFKDAQHLVFLAGANGMIVGNLLTIKGRSADDDLAVIDDLGLEVEG